MAAVSSCLFYRSGGMPVWSERIVLGAALLALFAGFLWLSIAVVERGLSSGDDAYLALAAKNLAFGNGYGLPGPDGEILLFSPVISTGPAIIAPVALAIRIFGVFDWLPGAVTLTIFVCQMLATTIILWRGFGWDRVASFMFLLLTLLLLISSHNWYFGSLLGETPAFGFLLMAIAVLSLSQAGRTIACAGVFLSLAYLSKQIALFAAIGIVIASTLLLFQQRRPLSQIVAHVAIISLSALLLPMMFEFVKISSLGWKSYVALWDSTVAATLRQAVGSGETPSRLASFLETFASTYSAWLLGCLAVISILVLIAFQTNGDIAPINDRSARRNATYFSFLAWSGATTYFAYILFVSTLWSRYFWIGVAVACSATAAPALALGSRARTAMIASILLVVALFRWYEPFYRLHQRISSSTAPQEREVVQQLLAKEAIPFAGEWWSSICDIVFLQRSDRRWVYGPSVRLLQGKPFIGIINTTFTDVNSVFSRAVTRDCELLTPGARLILAYRCSDSFWKGFESPLHPGEGS